MILVFGICRIPVIGIRRVGSVHNKRPVLSWYTVYESSVLNPIHFLSTALVIWVMMWISFWVKFLGGFKPFKGCRFAIKKSCFKSMLKERASVDLPAVSVSTWDKHYSGRLCLTECPRRQASALFLIQNRWGTVVSILHSWSCFSAGRRKGARCPFAHSVSPICQPSFNLSLGTTRTVPPWTYCPFSLTLATCHWKESITLSAHSERAVKRPVVGDKALRLA